MTYRIAGLDPQLFAPLFALDDGALAARNACRIEATSDRGYPCRISLDDARKGEPVILAQFVSHPVQTPFRFAYAIYIRAGVEQAEYLDRTTQRLPVVISRCAGSPRMPCSRMQSSSHPAAMIQWTRQYADCLPTPGSPISMPITR